MYINRNVWSFIQSNRLNDRKRPVLVLSTTSPYDHKLRERNAVAHALAAKIEWYSSDLDHWTVSAKRGDVEIELVSTDKTEMEKALAVINRALDSNSI